MVDHDTQEERYVSSSLSNTRNYQSLFGVTSDLEVKERLIEICQKELRMISSSRRPLNIAVIGLPGSGKSSLLNTTFAAFNHDKWRELSRAGDFGERGRQVSHLLVSYPKNIYYHRQTNDDVLMPTFWDMSGFENDYSDYNLELLKIVLFGRMKENETLSDVLKYGKDRGIDGLKEKYGQRDRSKNRMDRIIFVCSGDPDSPLPEDLMKSVYEVTSKGGIPVFGVFTRGDKFTGENPREQEREKEFIQSLGIEATRFVRIKNYCKDVVPDTSYMYKVVPQLDIKVLDLMQQVCSGAMRIYNPNFDPFHVEGVKKYRGDNVKRVPLKEKQPPSSSPKTIQFDMQKIVVILVSIQIVLIALILKICFKPAFDGVILNNVCAQYDMKQKKNNYEKWDEMDKLCEQKLNVSEPTGAFYVCLVIIIVGVPFLLLKFRKHLESNSPMMQTLRRMLSIEN